MAIAYLESIRNARLQLVADGLNGGSGAGLLRLYSGTRPSTGGTVTTLLAELTLSDPCEATVTGGVLTFDTITSDASANATGTATWFRGVDSDGTFVCDGDVGTSGADLNLNTTSIVATQTVAITSAAITAGND